MTVTKIKHAAKRQEWQEKICVLPLFHKPYIGFTLTVKHFYEHAAASKEIAEKSLRNLKFDNKTVEAVTQLVESHDRTIEPRKPVVHRCLNKFGKEQFIRLVYLKAADKSAQMQVTGEKSFSTGKIIALVDEIEEQKDCLLSKIWR